MPADWLSVAGLVLSWAATYLVHSTLLMAAVWAYFKIRPNSGHSIREMLWKTALVGGFATALGQTLLLPAGPLGSLTWALPSVVAQPVDSSAKHDVAAGMIEIRASSDGPAGNASRSNFVGPEHEVWIMMDPDVDATDWHQASNPDDKSAGTMTVSGPTSGNETVTSLGRLAAIAPLLTIVALALGAVAIGMLNSLWQTLALSRKLAACTPLDAGPARKLLDELCRLVPRVPDIRLLAAADDAEPAALGVRQWTIVLPRRAAEDLPVDELRSLLAHELAHLVRGDAVWLCISRVVCSCLAFQPLNHLARREWQRAAEFLCDAWAVRRTGSPLALARCLTEVASWRLAERSSMAALAATGRKSGLVDRIERLLDARPHVEAGEHSGNRQRAIVFGAIGLVVLAWCAPRVTVIAGGKGAERFEGAASTTIDEGTIVEERIPGASEVAKPQVGGERHTEAEEGEVRDLNAPIARERETLMAPQSVPEMLAALDRDLAALEAELGEIEPLLRNVENAPQAVRLAARLQSEIAHLKQRRELLKFQSKLVVQ
jgi:Zn-dependent protease with chaperone function